MVDTTNNHILNFFFKYINRLKLVKLLKNTQVRVLLLEIITNNNYGFFLLLFIIISP